MPQNQRVQYECFITQAVTREYINKYGVCTALLCTVLLNNFYGIVLRI